MHLAYNQGGIRLPCSTSQPPGCWLADEVASWHSQDEGSRQRLHSRSTQVLACFRARPLGTRVWSTAWCETASPHLFAADRLPKRAVERGGLSATVGLECLQGSFVAGHLTLCQH